MREVSHVPEVRREASRMVIPYALYLTPYTLCREVSDGPSPTTIAFIESDSKLRTALDLFWRYGPLNFYRLRSLGIGRDSNPNPNPHRSVGIGRDSNLNSDPNPNPNWSVGTDPDSNPKPCSLSRRL